MFSIINNIIKYSFSALITFSTCIASSESIDISPHAFENFMSEYPNQDSNFFDHKKRLIETYKFSAPRLNSSGKYLEIGAASPISQYLSSQGVEVVNFTGELSERLDFPSCQFDGIFFLEGIERLKDLEGTYFREFNYSGVNHALRELKRLLKPEGYLFLTTPNASSFDAIGKIIKKMPALHYAPHVKEYTKQEIIEISSRLGLTLQDCLICDVWNQPEGINRAAISSLLLSIGEDVSERGDNMMFAFSPITINFEKIVGFGQDCATKAAIESYYMRKFGTSNKEDVKQYTGGGYPFDWMVMGNFLKLAENLNRNFENFFARESLRIVEHSYDNQTLTSVKDVDNDILWNHLFSKEGGTTTTSEIFEREYEDKKQKLGYMLDKLKALKSAGTVYMISGPVVPLSTLRVLQDAILNYRDQDPRFCLLFVSTQAIQDMDIENIKIRNIKDFSFVSRDLDRFGQILSEFKLD